MCRRNSFPSGDILKRVVPVPLRTIPRQVPDRSKYRFPKRTLEGEFSTTRNQARRCSVSGMHRPHREDLLGVDPRHGKKQSGSFGSERGVAKFFARRREAALVGRLDLIGSLQSEHLGRVHSVAALSQMTMESRAPSMANLRSRRGVMSSPFRRDPTGGRTLNQFLRANIRHPKRRS